MPKRKHLAPTIPTIANLLRRNVTLEKNHQVVNLNHNHLELTPTTKKRNWPHDTFPRSNAQIARRYTRARSRSPARLQFITA